MAKVFFGFEKSKSTYCNDVPAFLGYGLATGNGLGLTLPYAAAAGSTYASKISRCPSSFTLVSGIPPSMGAAGVVAALLGGVDFLEPTCSVNMSRMPNYLDS